MFKQPLVAIDIGSSAVKVVESVGANAKKLGAIGLETIPAGAVVDGAIQDADGVQNTLEELLKRLKILTPATKAFGRRVAISLGGSAVIVKRISVAASSEEDLEEQIDYEAEQHFQSDLADMYYYHSKLGSSGNETTILLAGARREVVEEYLAIVRSVGMRIGVIECDVFSTSNMFEFNYGVVEGLAALVNIGAALTQISLLYNGEYLFTREVPIGGNDYSQAIVDSMSVDLQNAESLKISASSGEANSPPELQGVISGINEQMVSEIQQTMDFFFTSGILPESSGGLSSVFLTGGSSRILGLDASLAASLQVPVNILNPFQRIDVNPGKFDMDYLSMQGHLYGIAVGLSLRSMNDYK